MVSCFDCAQHDSICARITKNIIACHPGGFNSRAGALRLPFSITTYLQG